MNNLIIKNDKWIDKNEQFYNKDYKKRIKISIIKICKNIKIYI